MIIPSQLKLLCEKYGLRPSKQYSQNFLIVHAPIRKMIEAAQLTKEDTVVEIGPGFGVLTMEVASLVKKVVAFEIERRLEKYWEEKIKEFSNVEIVWGDAVKEITNHKSQIPNKYKVMANLPYGVTSSVLRVILEAENKPEMVVVMVQKEVAQRICSKKEMSLLAISVQYYGVPKIVARVPAGCFWPEPKVESAVLQIINHKSEIINQDSELFFKFVRSGFLNKRKQLWRNLATDLGLDGEKVKNVLKKVMGNEMVRAEELSVEDWKKVVGELRLKD